MTCKCGSERIAYIGGKVSDLGNCDLPTANGVVELEGYMPDIKDVCSGDYIEMHVCLDCGQVQREWPLTEEEVQEIIERHNDE